MDIVSARFSQILKVSLWVMDVAPAVVLDIFNFYRPLNRGCDSCLEFRNAICIFVSGKSPKASLTTSESLSPSQHSGCENCNKDLYYYAELVNPCLQMIFICLAKAKQPPNVSLT